MEGDESHKARGARSGANGDDSIESEEIDKCKTTRSVGGVESSGSDQ